MATKRFGMLIDLRKCVGCEACTVACKSENDVPLGHFRTTVQTHESGTFPKVSLTFIPTLCNHCENPGCVSVCPVLATFKLDNGTVVINDDCIGCQYCVSACPYGARYFNQSTGVVDKCNYCIHRVEKGIVPSCVNTCVADARIFGDLNDPNSAISLAIAKGGVVQLKNTNTYYIPTAGLDRKVLPPDYKPVGALDVWQSALQPVGKAMLGGAIAATVISMGSNALNKSSHSDEEMEG